MYQHPKAFYDEKAFDNGELLYHIKLKQGDTAKYVLLPSNPKNVAVIAGYLDNAKLIADYREYVTVTGEYKGIPVSIVSTGMGGPSTAIAVEELIKVGACTFIRIGTSRGLSPKLKHGDLIIAQGAIKDEGTPSEYIPHEYPALADINVIRALKEASEALNSNHHIGVVHSTDSVYGTLEPDKSFFRERSTSKLEDYTRAGALGSDMESAALFSIASLRRVRAGCIMAVMRETEQIVRVALNAIVILEQATKGEKNA